MNIRALIIDDEKDICFLISEILNDENFTTDVALNSSEALKKFESLKPELIILDVWLGNSDLDGIELFIVGCLREDPHPTHVDLPTALSWIERINPKRAVITHMNHTLDYDDLKLELPESVEPAYDGLALSI